MTRLEYERRRNEIAIEVAALKAKLQKHIKDSTEDIAQQIEQNSSMVDANNIDSVLKFANKHAAMIESAKEYAIKLTDDILELVAEGEKLEQEYMQQLHTAASFN